MLTALFVCGFLMGADQWDGDFVGGRVRGPGGGARGGWAGGRHDSPEEDGRPRAATCGPARHGQDGAIARRSPGARQQGLCFQLLIFLAQISYSVLGGKTRVLFLPLFFCYGR